MKKPITILIVDDNPILLNVLAQAAQTTFPEAVFSQVLSTTQAINYVDGLSGEQPSFVIVSIESNDTISGFNFLALLKARAIPFMAPVFLLSASYSEEDILDAYHFGAASCLVRSHDADQWGQYLALIRLHYLHYQ